MISNEPTNASFLSFQSSLKDCFNSTKKKASLKHHFNLIAETHFENLEWQENYLSSLSSDKTTKKIKRKIVQKTEKEKNKRYYCLIKGLGTKYDFRGINKDPELAAKVISFHNLDVLRVINSEQAIQFVDSIHRKILLNPTEKLESYTELKSLQPKKNFEKIKTQTGEEILQKQLAREKRLFAITVTVIVAGIAIGLVGLIFSSLVTSTVVALALITLGSIGCLATTYAVKSLNIHYDHAKLKKVVLE